MPKILPIQHTFDAGELSPTMLARSDLALYNRGVGLAENVVPLIQGPISGRRGMAYMTSVLGSKGRIFSFQESWDDSYSVIVTNRGKIYVTDEVEVSSYAVDLIVNGSFDRNLLGWNTIENLGRVDVVREDSHGPSTRDHYLQLTSVDDEDNGWVECYQFITTIAPTTEHFLSMQIPREDEDEEVELRIGTDIGLGDIYTGTFTGSVYAHFTPDVSEFWFTIHKNGTSDGVKLINRVSIRVTIPTPGGDLISFNHPWSSNLEMIHAKMPPGDPILYFTHPNFPPQRLIHNTDGTWDFDTVTFIGQPGTWVSGAYPRTLAFFEGRSWWGGPKESFYASKSGELLDLTPGTDDAEGLSFTMGKRGEIMWLVGLKNLLLGTRNAEHIITSEGGIITSSDINVEQQSSYGSNHCQPIELGSKAAYVTPDGRRVQDIGYQWTAEQWLSTDLTFSGEHLTEGTGITELLWAQNPSKLIGCHLTEGGILICVYDPEKDIIGWTHFETDGFVHSACVVELRGKSFFVGLVARDSSYLYLELFGSDTFLDSSKQEYSVDGKNTIDAGEHLANRLVTVKIDDALHPPVRLNVVGEAVLEWSGNVITYGLPYTQRVQLLPRDFPYTGGSTTSLKKRWNKVWVRILASVLPQIGGNVLPDRSPKTRMNTREGLKSQDVQVTTLGYDEKGAIMITNDLPLPMTILGVFGEMSADKVG